MGVHSHGGNPTKGLSIKCTPDVFPHAAYTACAGGYAALAGTELAPNGFIPFFCVVGGFFHWWRTTLNRCML